MTDEQAFYALILMIQYTCMVLSGMVSEKISHQLKQNRQVPE